MLIFAYNIHISYVRHAYTKAFFINYKPIVNFCTMSFWVSIYIYFVFIIFVYIFIFCLPNKLYIIIIIIIMQMRLIHIIALNRAIHVIQHIKICSWYPKRKYQINWELWSVHKLPIKLGINKWNHWEKNKSKSNDQRKEPKRTSTNLVQIHSGSSRQNTKDWILKWSDNTSYTTSRHRAWSFWNVWVQVGKRGNQRR